MTTDELAKQIAGVVVACQARVRGTGADQYAEADGQQFERMTVEQLLREARDEAYDLVNYGVMTVLRIEQILDNYNQRLKVAL